MEDKIGLYKIGYVPDSNKVVEDFCAISSSIKTWEELNKDVENADKIFANSRGYDEYEGKPVTEEKAAFLRFQTSFSTSNGNVILGWFEKNKKGGWKWGNWGIFDDYKQYISEKTKFRIGHLVFNRRQDGETFLNEIAVKALPESWDFNNGGKYSILRSYIENVYERLLHEEKSEKGRLLYSNDKKYLLFNTNLLDKFSHDIFIIAECGTNGDAYNPRYSKGLKERLDVGFTKDVPPPPQFFKDVNDIIYQTSWAIDKEYDAFYHIIEERRSRFSEKYSETPTEQLAKKLQDAIDFAVVLAQRNYKFIVPMYRPQTNSIQLLMPIYLEGIYNTKPDFALVLTLDAKHQMYIPETILSLDMCYQNARLIAKPDETWLNPKLIQE